MLPARDPGTRPLCRNVASRGFCSYGERCRYSHNQLEQSARPPPAKIPCFSWEDTGTCSYGSRCAYLHRPVELVGSGPLHVGLLQVISTFVRCVRADEQDKVAISNFLELASFDWIRTLRPTIAVPGKSVECEGDESA